jgi:hypothetical protein
MYDWFLKMTGEQLPDTQKIIVSNVRTAAGFPAVPADISPELRKPVEILRSGRELTKEQIIEMVEREVRQNSNL